MYRKTSNASRPPWAANVLGRRKVKRGRGRSGLPYVRTRRLRGASSFRRSNPLGRGVLISYDIFACTATSRPVNGQNWSRLRRFSGCFRVIKQDAEIFLDATDAV